MSLRRQPASVELKNGNPDVRVEKLNASMSNHYTWIVEITNLLQSKALWEGVTVNVDPFMISSAAAIMSEANAPQEEQDTTALIQALASGISPSAKLHWMRPQRPGQLRGQQVPSSVNGRPQSRGG